MTSIATALYFDSPGALEKAVRALREKGVSKMEAFTPYPVEAVDELLEKRTSRLPLVGLIGGVLGGAGGYYMQYYTAAIWYPVNIGGRPLHSWPAFIPITFEMTVLGAALAIFAFFFVFTGLPRPHHPVFSLPESERVSDDQFLLCISPEESALRSPAAQTLLAGLGARKIVRWGPDEK